MIINLIHNNSATLGKVSTQEWLCIIYVKTQTMHTADHVKYEVVQIDRTWNITAPINVNLLRGKGECGQ